MDSHRFARHPAHASRHLFSIDPSAHAPLGTPLSDDREPWWADCEGFRPQPPAPHSDRFDDLIAVVGGVDALMHLDEEPLPDEAFDWTAVEVCDRPFVDRVIALSDRYCDEMLDREYRTISRRVLARVAARDPRTLRRSTNAERCAAGLVWLVGRANGDFGRRGMRTSQRLWQWFDVTDCADRGRSLRSAAGLESDAKMSFSWDAQLTLGDPTLLHSRFRRGLITQRDVHLKLMGDRHSRLVSSDGRTAMVQAEATAVVAVAKCAVEGGERIAMLLALGTDLDDANFYALSVPDARELVHKLQRALDDPPPRRGP